MTQPWHRIRRICLLAVLIPMFAQGEMLDGSRGQIRFYGTQMGAQVERRFQRFSADTHFDPNDLAHSSVHLVIDLDSIDLASEESEDEIKGTH
jgi:polyisoprenoid-binding protein YceI